MNQKGDFVIRMPMTIFKKLKTGNQKALMMAIFSFSDNGKNPCFASLRRLAERAGFSVGTAHNTKKQLIEKGFIKVAGKKKVFGGYTDSISVQQVNTSVQKKGARCSAGEQRCSAGEQRCSAGEQRCSNPNQYIQLNKHIKINTSAKTYPNKSSINAEVLKEIACARSVSLETAASVLEDIDLYVQSTGNSYKNWRATLEAWIKRKIKSKEISQIGKLEQEYEKLVEEDHGPQILS